MATVTGSPDELAAPLDLRLTSATRPFVRRMMPDATWVRFGTKLPTRPSAVVGRDGTLGREFGGIVAGQSRRAPAKADKRFDDPALRQNPLLRRIMLEERAFPIGPAPGTYVMEK